MWEKMGRFGGSRFARAVFEPVSYRSLPEGFFPMQGNAMGKKLRKNRSLGVK